MGRDPRICGLTTHASSRQPLTTCFGEVCPAEQSLMTSARLDEVVEQQDARMMRSADRTFFCRNRRSQPS
jgi:hypothetical protein